jgi:predicted permease
LTSLLHDLQLALRLAFRRPFFSVVVILSLALGIGVNVTIFGWIQSTVLNPLPGVPASGDLVSVIGRNSTGPIPIDYEDYLELRRSSKVFRSSCGFDMLTLGLRFQARVETVWTQIIAGDFFDTLEIRPALGRLLTSADSQHGKPLIAVLSYDYWVRRFRSDPRIVGRPVLLQGKPCTIVGVAPAGFFGAASGLRMDAFVPLEPYLDATKDGRATHTPQGANEVLARLSPGVSLEQASRRVGTLYRELVKRRKDGDTSWEAFVVPMSRNRHGFQALLRTPMLVLGFAAAFLLLVACCNVGNLFLARGVERQGEFAIRMAMGGSRATLVLQLLVEALPLGVAGGVIGILAGWASQRLLLGLLPPTHFPLLLMPRLDAGALLFGVLLSLVALLAVSVLPALISSDVELVPAMKEGGAGSQGMSPRRLMSSLIVAELGLATLLLTLTGHVIRTMIALQNAPTGFQMQNQLAIGLDFGASGIRADQRTRLVKDLLVRAREIRGVVAAAVGSSVPLDFGGFWAIQVEPEGHTFERGRSPTVDWNGVSPAYFRTLGIPLLRGREFDDEDAAGSEPVAIVDDRFARRFWPSEDPVGKRVKLGDGSTATVVGVVRAISYRPFGSDRGLTLYQPFSQSPMSSAALHVRAKDSPLALVRPLRSTLSVLAPTLPMAYVRDLRSFQRGARFPLVIMAQILGALGIVTLILAAVGTYGLVAHATARRSREFGIRLAMGATPGDVYRLVVGQGARLALVALVLGLGGAIALGQVLKSVIAELGDVDPLVLGGVSLLMAAVTFFALVVPARRASLTEPSNALKEE